MIRLFAILGTLWGICSNTTVCWREIPNTNIQNNELVPPPLIMPPLDTLAIIESTNRSPFGKGSTSSNGPPNLKRKRLKRNVRFGSSIIWDEGGFERFTDEFRFRERMQEIRLQLANRRRILIVQQVFYMGALFILGCATFAYVNSKVGF